MGKSSVVTRFVNSDGPLKVELLVEDLYTKVIGSDNNYHEVLVFDGLAKNDLYLTSRKQQIRNCLAIMLVYAVDDRELFDGLEDLYTRIVQLRNKLELPELPLVIVGNKLDLDVRQVLAAEGAGLATKLGCLGFFEVSAKTGDGIDDAFTPLVARLDRRKRYSMAPPKNEGDDEEEVRESEEVMLIVSKATRASQRAKSTIPPLQKSGCCVIC